MLTFVFVSLLSRILFFIASCVFFFFFFFFQAEDGIRDLIVTGVQTCALPISLDVRGRRPDVAEEYRAPVAARAERVPLGVEVDGAGERIGDDQRRRREIVGDRKSVV